MHFNTEEGTLQSEINITPLVDVVLVLLIIFMVVVPLLLQGYDIDIPRVSTEAVPAESEELQVVLSIHPEFCNLTAPPAGEGVPPDCLVTLANTQIPASELPARVAELLAGRPPERRVIFLDANDGMNYEGVLRIVDLAKAGVDDLKIEFLALD